MNPERFVRVDTSGYTTRVESDGTETRVPLPSYVTRCLDDDPNAGSNIQS